MSKYTKLLDGCTLMDKVEGETGYNYYGYVRTGTSGEWVIMRENTAGTEYRFAIGGSGYSAKWAVRGSIGYKIPTDV